MGYREPPAIFCEVDHISLGIALRRLQDCSYSGGRICHDAGIVALSAGAGGRSMLAGMSMQDIGALLRSIAKLVLQRGVERSYSQDGEDLLVGALLRGSKGIYLDIGAYHPVLYSNTYSFYKKGWQGVVVDPNAALSPLYRWLRPRDRFIHAAVAAKEGNAEYFRFSDGAYNTLSSAETEERKQNRHIRYLGSESVSVRPLAQIIKDAQLSRIDFLSVDVEGLDVEVLESHDWVLRPEVIAIEDNGFDAHEPASSRAFVFLTEKGYRLVAFSPRTLIFKSKESMV